MECCGRTFKRIVCDITAEVQGERRRFDRPPGYNLPRDVQILRHFGLTNLEFLTRALIEIEEGGTSY